MTVTLDEMAKRKLAGVSAEQQAATELGAWPRSRVCR
jgi:hypothetical protein